MTDSIIANTDSELFQKIPEKPESPEKIKHLRKLIPVTPGLARHWLEERNTNNPRNPSSATSDSYTKKMKLLKEIQGEYPEADLPTLQVLAEKAGAWIPGHPDSIQFDNRGRLGNGQHRLIAVVKSGITILMWVEVGLDPVVFAGTDHGYRRTGAHGLKNAGFRDDVSHLQAFAIGRVMVAGLKRKEMSTSPRRVDEDFVKKIVMEHETAIGITLLAMKGVKPNRAEVTAAFCKAFFVYDADKVQQAAIRYATQAFNSNNDPLRKLHDKAVAVATSGNRHGDLYGYAVAAVRAALENRTLAKLQETELDFPGPWETEYKDPKQREKARQGWQTFRENLEEIPDRVAKAKEIIEKVQKAGITFAINKETKEVTPNKAKVAAALLVELKTFWSEIKELLLAS